MTLDALGGATALSAAIALTGARPDARWARWHPFWPVPLMLFAGALAARDLAALLGRRQDVPVAVLTLGVWAAAMVVLAGAAEISAGIRGSSDGRHLVSAALIGASGVALLLRQGRPASAPSAAGVSGVLVLLAGVLLATLRTSRHPPTALRILWPVALLGGAMAQPLLARRQRDPMANARLELENLVAALRRAGSDVVPARPSTPLTGDRSPGPDSTFMVDANEVQVFLIAHDDDLSPEAHLSRRLSLPPPLAGLPHLHAGRHILVVCITTNPDFVRYLDRLVQNVGGPRRSTSFTTAEHVLPAVRL